MTSERGDRATPSSPLNDFNIDEDERRRSQSLKFRFKSAKRRLDPEEDYRTPSRSDERRHGHRHHRRSKRRKQDQSSPPDDSTLYDNTHLPNTYSEPYLDPDTAFRESLFDAMADDEGAQFWEGVYGQPIPKIPAVQIGPAGELETMTEDEYAEYVRSEMYKKTHQYLLEEKARREQAKKERARLAEQARREGDDAERFQQKVEESLRKGRERKERAQRTSDWAENWSAYENSWSELKKVSQLRLAQIPWPVWGGRREDIGKEEVESFFLNAPTSGQPEQADLLRTLKAERVRWHPDKIQQKLGGQGVDERQMQAVTAVFQIIDRMWSELRDHKASDG